MNQSLEASYRRCARVTRLSASNFYWSFWLLPRPKRRAMCALYAFSRRTDDLGDSQQAADVRRQELRQWRETLHDAFDGRFHDPLLPALVDTVTRYEIPHEYLFDILDGVEMDLETCRYQTFDQLREYCYRVAAAVGLACIHVWGFSDERAREAAISCGLAFQLTNILRDLKEDAERNRVYLPLEDLERFGYSCGELRRGVRDDRFTALMRFEIERAEQFYRDAANLTAYLSADGRRILRMMTATYRRLLTEIKRCDGDVFTRRVRLSLGRKLAVATGSLFGEW